jgi:hypothetical protein
VPAFLNIDASTFPNTDAFTLPNTNTLTFPNTNALTFPNTDVFTFPNVDALTHYNSNEFTPQYADFDLQSQERPATTSRSISTVSDFTQPTMLPMCNSPTERAARMRALNKEDQGVRSYSWAELKNLDEPTHNSLRWAEYYFYVYLVRDRFPSRQSSDVDATVDVGISLYALEHGVQRPGEFLVPSSPLIRLCDTVFRTQDQHSMLPPPPSQCYQPWSVK